MSRTLAEYIHLPEEFNAILQPFKYFSSWIDVGCINRQTGSLPHRNLIPSKKGVYILAFVYNDTIYPFYAGQSTAKREGMRHRICTEFYVSQKNPTQCGGHLCSELDKLGVHEIRICVSVCEMEDNSQVIDCEKRLLGAFDFISNKRHNNRVRSEALLRIVRPPIIVNSSISIYPWHLLLS